MANLVIIVFLCFAMTVVIESGVAFALGYRSHRDLKCVFLVNVITNPALNFILIAHNIFMGKSPSELLIFVLEALIVIIEWRLLAKATNHGSKKMFLLSLAMNSASYLIGLLLESSLFWSIF